MTAWQAVARTDNSSTNAVDALIGGASGTARPATSRYQGVPRSALLLAAVAKVRQGWHWIENKRTQQLTSRRLRVQETISLGDKRFVSILQVDGAQYLIGGSSTNVQLLAVLDQQNEASKTAVTL